MVCPGTIIVRYSDYHLLNKLVFRPPFEYQSTIHMPGTIVPVMWIANHLNDKQVKVSYSDVSAFPIFASHMPTNFHQCKELVLKWLKNKHITGHIGGFDSQISSKWETVLNSLINDNLLVCNDLVILQQDNDSANQPLTTVTPCSRLAKTKVQ